jgi:hypothetical protein
MNVKQIVDEERSGGKRKKIPMIEGEKERIQATATQLLLTFKTKNQNHQNDYFCLLWYGTQRSVRKRIRKETKQTDRQTDRHADYDPSSGRGYDQRHKPWRLRLSG